MNEAIISSSYHLEKRIQRIHRISVWDLLIRPFPLISLEVRAFHDLMMITPRVPSSTKFQRDISAMQGACRRRQQDSLCRSRWARYWAEWAAVAGSWLVVASARPHTCCRRLTAAGAWHLRCLPSCRRDNQQTKEGYRPSCLKLIKLILPKMQIMYKIRFSGS